MSTSIDANLSIPPSLARLYQVTPSNPQQHARALLRCVSDALTPQATMIVEKHRRRPRWDVFEFLRQNTWHRTFHFPEDALPLSELAPLDVRWLEAGRDFQAENKSHFPFSFTKAVAFRVHGTDDSIALVFDPTPTDQGAVTEFLQAAVSIWRATQPDRFACRDNGLPRSFDQALAAQGAAFWEIDMVTGELRTSGYEQLLGIKSSELPTHISQWHARTHPDDLPRVKESYYQYQRQSPPRYECEYRVRNGAGEWVWLHSLGHGESLFGDGGPPIRMCGFDRDLTAQRAEHATDLAFKRTTSMLQVAMFSVDDAGKITTGNDAAATLFGRPSHMLAGTPLPSLMADDSGPLWSVIQESLQTPESRWESEVEFHACDGRRFSADLRAVRDHDNDLILVAVLPTANRKQQEKAAWTQKQVLSHAARLHTMGELVGAIAHEMTQPLSAVSNFASACRTRVRQAATDDGLVMPPNPAEQLSSWLESIIESVHSAGAIIDRLRKFSKRSAPHRSTFDLHQLLEESIQLHIGEAYNEHAKIRSKLAQGDPLVIVDEVQLHQVMSNLIHNAFEATEGQEERWVIVQSEIRDGEVIVTVEDNGTGVSPEIAAMIYEPFETTRPDRMGVGLAIAKTIVEAHHGRIWNETIPSGGAAFCFALPLTGVS